MTKPTSPRLIKLHLKTLVILLTGAYVWGHGSNVVLNSALYHILLGHGVMDTELGQGYFMLGAAVIMAVGFLLFVWGVVRLVRLR